MEEVVGRCLGEWFSPEKVDSEEAVLGNNSYYHLNIQC